VTLGGILTAAFSWQSVLFVTGAVAAVVGVAGWILLPAEKARTRRPFDAAGASLLTGAAVAVVFGVLSAPHRGLVSIEVIGAAILAVACVTGFVLAERRAADPVLPTDVLRDTRVSGGIAVNLLGGAARIACFVLVALLLQQVLEYGPALAGLAMLPTSVAGFLISVPSCPGLSTGWDTSGWRSSDLFCSPSLTSSSPPSTTVTRICCACCRRW
jgi:predicted MFS family arabinose efflux permease